MYSVRSCAINRYRTPPLRTPLGSHRFAHYERMLYISHVRFGIHERIFWRPQQQQHENNDHEIGFSKMVAVIMIFSCKN